MTTALVTAIKAATRRVERLNVLLEAETAEERRRRLQREQDAVDAEQTTDTGPQHRDALLAPLAGSLATRIASAPRVGSAPRSVLSAAYTHAYRLGLTQGNPDHTWGSEDAAYVRRTVADQAGYLRGFAQDVGDGLLSDAEISARAALYGGPLTGAYSQGLVAGGSERGVQAYIWNTQGDDSCCENCAPRDGVQYAEEDLPGFPGEGDFGSELCLGGPQCRCSLEPVEPE